MELLKIKRLKQITLDDTSEDYPIKRHKIFITLENGKSYTVEGISGAKDILSNFKYQYLMWMFAKVGEYALIDDEDMLYPLFKSELPPNLLQKKTYPEKRVYSYHHQFIKVEQVIYRYEQQYHKSGHPHTCYMCYTLINNGVNFPYVIMSDTQNQPDWATVEAGDWILHIPSISKYFPVGKDKDSAYVQSLLSTFE